MHVEHASLYALLVQRRRRLESETHCVAHGDDGHVLALAELHRLAYCELGPLVVDDRHGVAGEAQEHRPVGLRRRAHQLFGRDVVGGLDDRHVRDGAQDAHVLYGLVACAVVRRGEAAVGAGYLDVQVRVADLLPYHLAHAQRAEHRVGDDEGDLARRREAGGKGRRVLLGYAHVHILLRQGLHELARLAALADVRVHDVDIAVFLAQLHDLLAEAVARRYHITNGHRYIPLSSCSMALSYCALFGALPCQSREFSM